MLTHTHRKYALHYADETSFTLPDFKTSTIDTTTTTDRGGALHAKRNHAPIQSLSPTQTDVEGDKPIHIH